LQIQAKKLFSGKDILIGGGFPIMIDGRAITGITGNCYQFSHPVCATGPHLCVLEDTGLGAI